MRTRPARLRVEAALNDRSTQRGGPQDAATTVRRTFPGSLRDGGERHSLAVVAVVAVVLASACSSAPNTGGALYDWDAVASDGSSATGGTGADGGSDGSSGTGTAPDSAHLKAGCIDGDYDEALPTPTASIEALIGAYDSKEAFAFVLAVLEARYPTGRFLVDQGVAKGQQNCFDLFLPVMMRGTAKSTLDRIEVLVHECGHLYDLSVGGFSSHHYHISDKVQRTCAGGSAQAGGKTFARSRLQSDTYALLRPACSKGSGPHGCDSYADVYLNGNPDDAKFESGDQGFDLLHEETVQYVHSLATASAFSDRIVGSTSARDGILTFLWYTERYLRMARTEYPKAYAALVDDPCWREAILLTWARAWRMLDATADNKKLGIQAKAILPLVEDPDLLNEVELVRAKHGCK